MRKHETRKDYKYLKDEMIDMNIIIDAKSIYELSINADKLSRTKKVKLAIALNNLLYELDN